jgi:choline dehydrogenase-like flavoprotein
MVRMPKGFGKLMTDPRRAWFYDTDHHERVPGARPEKWWRGKLIGGSSAVNGMVYHRGQPQDYDRLAELGLAGWSWREVLPYFIKLENHELPATDFRGRGGPLDLMLHPQKPRLSEAILQAGKAMGLPIKEEPNLPNQEGISYIVYNIDPKTRERVSAGKAFLTPEVRARANLRILTQTRVDRVLFEGRRAVGVACTLADGSAAQYRAQGEVILSAGAIHSPQLLQVSGIGPAPLLQSLGIPLLQDLPGVGANLREHWNFWLQFRLRHAQDSENRDYAGLRLLGHVLHYLVAHRGLMSWGSTQMSAFIRTRPDLDRPDAQLMFAPYSLDFEAMAKGGAAMEKQPGMHMFGYPLRGTSQGSVTAQSADMAQLPKISPGYLLTDYDRQVTIGLVRFIRRLMSQPVLAPYVEGEVGATAGVHTDDEIIDYGRRFGSTSFHGCGTCKMGRADDPMAVLDERLRVRGVQGLRVMDVSVLPEQLTANPCGPVMALAWRAADLILDDMRR